MKQSEEWAARLWRHNCEGKAARQGAGDRKKDSEQSVNGQINQKLKAKKRKLFVSWNLAFGCCVLPFSCLILPTLAQAQSTPAGTVIENEATGTYQDPNTGEINEVISNTVTISVAEVAGITVTAAGFTEADGNSEIEPGDLLYFNYRITNVGNDPTRFRIPNLATVTGPGTVTGNLQISVDGGQTWVDIAAGSTLAGFTFTADGVETGSFAPGGSIRVRVPVTLNPEATDGNEIAVQLGQTPNNAQNVAQTAEPGDVYTVDNPDGVAGETAGVPANGIREASATQTATVGANPLALPAIYKTHAEPINAGNPADASDDRITYNLALEVLSQTVTGSTGIVPADLAGTPITVNGTSVTRILISDVVPAGTQLTDTRTIPSQWQAIFTKDDPATVNALQAQWYTNPNDAAIGGLANVTRIGFILDGTVATGTLINGFSFQVLTSRLTTTATVANLAQVLGSTAGDPDSLVYDESGDRVPNNFNDDGTPGSTDSTGNPIIDTGVPNPGNQGTDPNNDNSGTGPGGEPNVVIVTGPSAGLLNGPAGAPGAVGPTDNNDDFVNKSAPIPPGLDPSQPVDPAPVEFTNTVQNTAVNLANITLLPTLPANANDLPAGTVVTIIYGNLSATYTYNPTAGFTSPQPPVIITNLAANQSANYSVQIDLPSTAQLRGYPVPVAAFIDSNGNGLLDTGEPANRKIDRVYTGFLRMLKESRLLKATGADVPAGQDTFSTTAKTPSPGNIIEFRFTYTNISTPGGGIGNVTLTAQDITITEDGTTYEAASNPKGNNWALDNDNSDGDNNPITGIDTSNVVGSALDSNGGTITFFSGRPATLQGQDQTGTNVNQDVTKYVNRVRGSLAPGQSGTFTFQRRVN
ncbi:hypothetical protein [Microcoleus sp. FACHB-672]|uniref:DUF7925 domain-containing protein n=1 Tax=Microcoleus sp. FACHB-672 TaxID=2692825 RepID=UPI0018EFC01D|nr:hypothetical protein [Microcoleus sp. FACHB-672]